MPLSVRLDPKTESAVKRLARRRNQTRSAVVREALAAFERDQAALQPRTSPWGAIAHLIGVADSGDGRLSEDTGWRLGTMLRQKARARHAR